MTLEEFRATFEPTVFIRVGEGIPRKVSDLGPDKGPGSRTEFNFCDGKILSAFFFFIQYWKSGIENAYTLRIKVWIFRQESERVILDSVLPRLCEIISDYHDE